MRLFTIIFALIGCLGSATQLQAAQARIVKVLPQFIDSEGRNSLSPSLYERDAYQAELRKKPEKCSGMRFDIQWKARGYPADSLKVKIEIRASKGSENKVYVLEEPVQPKGFLGYWAALTLKGEDYVKAGNVNAWRATLWSGDQQIAEQKSFLW